VTESQYHRQELFPPIGKEGQKRIRDSSVFLAGCGAVGSVIAAHLVRSGVGRLVFCDRDIVERTNLPRQSLFDLDDALKGLPKVEAAEKRLAGINPDTLLEPHAVDVKPDNIEELIKGADCIADGSDNFLLRFLINDAALKQGTPWIYTGVIQGIGHSLTIPAGGRPCLRCYMGDIPPPGSIATCDTAGVIGSAVGFMGSLASAEILRILAGSGPANAGTLTIADVWNNRHRRVLVEADPGCAACSSKRYEFLDGERGSAETVLCGSDSVQFDAAGEGLGCSLEELERKLSGVGHVKRGRFHLRFRHPPLSMTVFRDGRVIVSGTADPSKARSFRDKFL